jgi:cytochrome P450
VAVTSASDVYYDPYDVDIDADPYPTFRRLREEAPLYFNEPHDFWAASRHEDVERGLKDNETFISGRGGILELIKAGIEMPPGILIFEDPPTHTMHRRLLSRAFTPKRVSALEPKIRELCALTLDPLVGSGGFDVVRDIGAQIPMAVIGMLMGIPEADYAKVRDLVNRNLRTEAGKPMEVSQDEFALGGMFEEYIDWRMEHPSDDIMTELLHTEFEDETGTRRTLTRDEVLTYTAVVSGAGNETTTKLIGWTGKLLADHPDQRAELVADRALVPNAIEEVLRFEPVAPHVGRYVAKDVEIQGQTVPEGSAILFLVGSANRDEAQFPDGERFDIHRDTAGLLSFGYGPHFCLGASLARLEGRIVLDEMLQRFPEWDLADGAELAPTSTVRGYSSLPVTVP